ncbi:mannose-1-phosphate guanylyltransferase/mannose-6-phosphate isomerase [Cognatishimia sp. F0-27]|uniref:mannose-1-phosphate guanylyltransferase/mannose-6-phosphate isomerase n=1 Tax=Cognatishimia sp. F0-27 TaxID=2816855 RepID=UPI001D0C2846|nr:mannose-1-phosphate guanylyltransferase/mannose-6-phosphate isomerase [Cognatishimia sp. F0-27]MCC1494757.1 mannose-1-phosphate guanylyltransferase/mannose-6-phosphate isomerase [Cognatishimia sp. F0-27]
MITPVILCGGSGSRLWPLSRKSYPKQFSDLIGTDTLFQASARRVSGAAFTPPLIVTGEDFRFIVGDQLAACGITPLATLVEPEGRNTAPAILAAALHLARSDPGAMMLVLPSDHHIPDRDGFVSTVMQGLEAAQAGHLVTFGITPDRAETGYGYLELDAAGATGPVPLRRFVEKPCAARAAEMVADGRHLWNAGIFLFSVQAILAAFEAHAPQMIAPVSRAVEAEEPDLGFLRLEAQAWAEADDISIDYAVMERSETLVAVPFGAHWSDLGEWTSVAREMGPDADGNATHGAVECLDCTGTLMRSEAEGLTVVGLGLEDIITVAMPDAVLVAHKSRAQDVKQAVSVLKDKGARQAETFTRDHRPWGWFESLAMGPRFQVKRIVVKPGAALSLQSHHHRSEHWIVVEGTAKVTVDEEVRLVTENESIYIPLGAVHRMENPGKVPMVLIEVQTGIYLGEDDIVRYEDIYARK